MSDRQKEAIAQLQEYIMEVQRLPLYVIPDYCGRLCNLAECITDDLPVSTKLAIEQLDEMIGKYRTAKGGEE